MIDEHNVILSHTDVVVMKVFKRWNLPKPHHPVKTKQIFDFNMNLGGYKQ